MSKLIDFCYDCLGDNVDLGYPNLAEPDLAADQFDVTWPRVLPLRLLMYLQQFGFRFQSHLVGAAPVNSWYPVALAWHDFDCDYFDLISEAAKQRAQRREIRFLFYYHEGDHPGRLKQRFDTLCSQHHLPRSCYLFVSANSSANQHENFWYFNDHEYFLAYINRRQQAQIADEGRRPFEFTALNRIHKWWRSSVISDLYHHGVLDRSLWSYNTLLSPDLEPEVTDNPIRLDDVEGWRDGVQRFLDQGPYVCDGTDAVSHNDHRLINTDLYTQSYCNIVTETLLDVDQSGGSFLTEKTFKCIKFGQPFVIVGPVGSLSVLRDSGYRVFDHAIDNSYDKIKDDTDRWLALKQAILKIRQQDMHAWYLQCLADVQHNQWQFNTKTNGSLDRLVKRLTENPDSV